MPEITLTLTSAQLTRVNSAIANQYPDNNRTPSQLLKFHIKSNLKKIARDYERAKEINKITIQDF